MAKYRVAIIGSTGRGNYGHGLDGPWQHLDSCEVVAVADEHEGGRAAAIKRSGAKTGYSDYREMLAKEKPNIVAICQRWIPATTPMPSTCCWPESPFARVTDNTPAWPCSAFWRRGCTMRI